MCRVERSIISAVRQFFMGFFITVKGDREKEKKERKREKMRGEEERDRKTGTDTQRRKPTIIIHEYV